MAEKTGGPLGAGTETPQVRLDMDDLSAAFDRAVELVSEERRRTGGFPDIGARLPVLFQCPGLADVRMSIFQHMELAGVFKSWMLSTLTPDRAQWIATLGIADEAEVEQVLAEVTRH